MATTDTFWYWITAGTSATATTWTAWCNGTATDSITTSATTTSIIVWDAWSEDYADGEVVAEQRRIAEQQCQAAAIQQQRTAIKRQRQERLRMLRAKKLLKEQLNAEQRKMLADKDHFYMRSQSGKLFRIRNGRAGNVELMHDEQRIHKVLCAHPSDYCPNYDTMLAQKLMLETDEAQFMRKANVHRTYN